MTVTSINLLTEELLDKARAASNGRAATTIYARQGAKLRQTLVAMMAGSVLGEHKSPGDAALHCLQGRVILRAGTTHSEVAAGEMVSIPPQRHDVEALADSVLLLTVALH